MPSARRACLLDQLAERDARIAELEGGYGETSRCSRCHEMLRRLRPPTGDAWQCGGQEPVAGRCALTAPEVSARPAAPSSSVRSRKSTRPPSLPITRRAGAPPDGAHHGASGGRVSQSAPSPSLQHPAASRQDVADPIRVGAVREPNNVAAATPGDVHGRTVLTAGLAPRVHHHAEGGQVARHRTQHAIRNVSGEAGEPARHRHGWMRGPLRSLDAAYPRYFRCSWRTQV